HIKLCEFSEEHQDRLTTRKKEEEIVRSSYLDFSIVETAKCYFKRNAECTKEILNSLRGYHHKI
ncbi:hypothetical protein, partial [Pseudomonas lurida]|uniref:hypothetical protein n=1 Tax=Pseudomonas lurida TaxID=244566 RepID=UPI0034D9623B